MRAMILEKLVSLAEEQQPLRLVEWPDPEPSEGEIRIAVAAGSMLRPVRATRIYGPNFVPRGAMPTADMLNTWSLASVMLTRFRVNSRTNRQRPCCVPERLVTAHCS